MSPVRSGDDPLAENSVPLVETQPADQSQLVHCQFFDNDEFDGQGELGEEVLACSMFIVRARPASVSTEMPVLFWMFHCKYSSTFSSTCLEKGPVAKERLSVFARHWNVELCCSLLHPDFSWCCLALHASMVPPFHDRTGLRKNHQCGSGTISNLLVASLRKTEMQ